MIQDTESLKEMLKERLSKKRYQHSLNVADEARSLAKVWGEDEDRAYLAGLLHDVCKDITHIEQRKLVDKSKRDVTAEELEIPQLWHAIAGAVYCENALEITNEEILNAIRFHTVARKNMSLLEEIIYIADLTSADRDYDDVDAVRKLSRSNLRETMLYAIKFSINDVMKKGSLIPRHTIDAYNFYTLK